MLSRSILVRHIICSSDNGAFSSGVIKPIITNRTIITEPMIKNFFFMRLSLLIEQIFMERLV